MAQQGDNKCLVQAHRTEKALARQLAGGILCEHRGKRWVPSGDMTEGQDRWPERLPRSDL